MSVKPFAQLPRSKLGPSFIYGTNSVTCKIKTRFVFSSTGLQNANWRCYKRFECRNLYTSCQFFVSENDKYGNVDSGLRNAFSFARSILPGGSWWSLSEHKQDDVEAAKPMTALLALRRMWLLISGERWILFVALGSLVIAAVSEISMPSILAASVFSAQSGEVVGFYRKARSLLVLCFTSGICSGLRSGCFGILNAILVKRLRENLYAALLFQDTSYFDREQVGDLTSRLSADCQRLSYVIGNDLHLIFRNTLQGTGAIINLLTLSWPLALSSLVICPVLSSVFLVYGQYQRKAANLTQDFTASANEVAQETLSLVLAVLLGGMSVLCCCVTVEQLTKYVLYCEWLIFATWRVTNSLSSFLQSIGACEKVFQMMDLLPSDQFLSEGVKLQRLRGRIEFVNVSFCYPTRITDKRKMHLIAWDKVCTEKNIGGLGMRHIRQQNQAFMMKLGWGLVTNRDALWVKVIRHKYGCGSDLMPNIRIEKQGSNTWRGIKNNWKHTKDGIQLLMDRNGNEAVRWRWNKSGKFSTTSAYMALNATNEPPDMNWSKIWKLHIPHRCKHFVWLIIHERVLTNHRKYKRGIHQNGLCDRCLINQEDEKHVLRDCHEVRKMWERIIKPEMQHEFFSSDFKGWVDWNRKKQAGVTEQDWESVFFIICWLLWRARNEFIHANGRTGYDSLYSKAKAIRACMQNTKFKIQGVQMNSSMQHVTTPDTTSTTKNFVVEVDGAHNFSTRHTACGGVLKNQDGEIVEGFQFRLDQGDHLTAELWACLLGLKRAWDHGERNVVIRGDSAEAINLILGEENDLHVDWNTIHEIRNMQSWNWKVAFHIITRDQNYQADRMAKKALYAPLGLQLLSRDNVFSVLASP